TEFKARHFGHLDYDHFAALAGGLTWSGTDSLFLHHSFIRFLCASWQSQARNLSVSIELKGQGPG
ncbi:hypothetical protein ABG768_026993, partial [Culter alburnus]